MSNSVQAISAETEGVYVTLDRLLRLKHEASGFSFLPRQPVRSLLTGHHASRLRGRGLNFDELRAYQPGDDIGVMDWKVTARTQKPHVRVYTEERDHPCVLVVDQRITMFFGSQCAMKSVTAAEFAALSAWKVRAEGDRVGAVVFNDSRIQMIRPHRSDARVVDVLRTLVEQNRRLRVGAGIAANPEMLNRAIEHAARITPHDGLICLVTDFFGANARTRELLIRTAQHNDVVVAVIYDPLETQLPDAGKFTVSDGEFHLEFDSGDRSVAHSFADDFRGRMEQGRAILARLGVPVLPIHTASGAAEQTRSLLGHAPRQRRG